MNKYLITGITGFVGPNLANFLIEQGQTVYGLNRRSDGTEQDIRDSVPTENYDKINFLYGDITNPGKMNEIFKTNKFDGVFHLAAQSHPPTSFKDPVGTFKTNALGTINIANSLEKYQPDCALMFCSTSEVYGVVEKNKQPISEGAHFNPINPYGVSKASADFFIRERASSKNLPFFVTRAFSHTGLRRAYNFSISSDAYQLIKIKKGLQEPIISVGTLSSKRVVMDVKDCIKAYSMLMERAVNRDKKVIGKAFNVGGDELFSIGDLLEHMINISGLEGKVKKWVNPEFVRKIDIPIQIPDSEKLRTLTGWKPEISVVKQTLPELLDYWDRKIQH